MMGEGRGTGLVDPMFTEPFVDVDEWRDEPVRHRYVHGGFGGTDCRFSAYLPEEVRYQGRFFQPLSPVPGFGAQRNRRRFRRLHRVRHRQRGLPRRVEPGQVPPGAAR